MNKQWIWVATPLAIGVLLIALLFAVNARGGGLQITDVKEGKGRTAAVGDVVFVHYTGKLRNGTKFDSSFDHPGKQPFSFRIGAGEVIQGWDKGVAGMKEGGVRTLVIPPELGYGAKGSPPDIPANAELHFEIMLLKIEE